MRLTKKVSVGYNPAPQKYGSRAIYNKLGQLEDIEDELGIDLITYLKVMMDRVIYVKGKEPEWGGVGTKKDIEQYWVEYFSKDMLEVKYGKDSDSHFIKNPLKTYGKTWALTKEELK